MNQIRQRIFKTLSSLSLAAVMLGISSCSKSQSYSEMLRDEEHAVNAFLAQRQIALEIPADSISFETGPDAPFYKLDEDGYVYMQVIDKGDMSQRVEADDVVYFRFSRQDLKALYNGQTALFEGNSDDLTAGGFYFLYKNTTLQSSTQYGTGMQMPLRFFGYGCEVNLILRSYYGWEQDQTYCIPYYMNIRYFKPEY